MKFEFITGEVIEVFEEDIIKMLRADKRYKEITEEATSKKGKKAQKGENPNDEVQE